MSFFLRLPPYEILLMKHDVRDDVMRFFKNGQYAANKNDTEAELYSILDELLDNEQDFRAPDGYFHFKLCYPGNSKESLGR